MIINPVGSRNFSIGELTGLHFSDENCASINETLDWKGGCVSGRIEIFERAVAVASLEAGYIEYIFDASTYARERLRCRFGVVEPRGNSNARTSNAGHGGW